MRWEHSVLVNASVPRLWELTIDIANWPIVTPTVRWLERLDEGPVGVGSRARVKQPGQPVTVWTVTGVEPRRRFDFQSRRGGLILTATHMLAPAGAQCRQTLAIDVSGSLARLFGFVFGATVRTALRTENAGFKAAAESVPQTTTDGAAPEPT